MLHALTVFASSKHLATLLVRSQHFLPPPTYTGATGNMLQTYTLLGQCFCIPTMVRTQPLLWRDW